MAIKREVFENVTLYCGNCLDVLPLLSNESVDITVTSPPYNMGLIPGGNGRGMYRPGASNKAGRFRDGYGVHDDAMPQEKYDDWQRETLNEMWRVSKLAVYYNHRPRVEHGRLRTPLSFDFGKAILRQIIIWDRGTGIDVNLKNYCTRQEWIMLFTKESFRLIDHSASGFGDVWRLGMEYTETGHPAPFPVSLPERAILTTGAQSVIDPFMGSGSTGVACVRHGRHFIGVEIDPKHFDTACRRIEKSCKQSDLLSRSNWTKPVQECLSW